VQLRYGMNPQQAAAQATPVVPGSGPVRVVHGQPSLINLLDALNAWQLVREAARLLGRPAAASFKHTSPAGVALSGPVDEVAAAPYGTSGTGLSGVARAYLRARDADPKSSYGDFAAVSGPVDADLAGLLAGAVCDGIIGAGQQSRVDCTRLAGAKTDIWWLRRHPAIRALSFAPGLSRADKANWQVRLIEADLTAPERGQLAQVLTEPAAELSPDQRADWGRRLTGVAFASDGHLPFRDNVDHASRHGVTCIAEPGGSVRADQVAAACDEYGITLARTGLRLFHH
jgi:AICAR transformylase/IMP cyclohydrolase PurH